MPWEDLSLTLVPKKEKKSILTVQEATEAAPAHALLLKRQWAQGRLSHGWESPVGDTAETNKQPCSPHPKGQVPTWQE